MYTVPLTHFDDIQPSNAFAMPGSWNLKKGMRLAVNLKNGGAGALVLKSEYKPGCWRAEWDREGSPLHGRTFELGKQPFSDIRPTIGRTMPVEITWTTIIRLVP